MSLMESNGAIYTAGIKKDIESAGWGIFEERPRPYPWVGGQTYPRILITKPLVSDFDIHCYKMWYCQFTGMDPVVFNAEIVALCGETDGSETSLDSDYAEADSDEEED